MVPTRTLPISGFWKYALHAAAGLLFAATLTSMSATSSQAGVEEPPPLPTVTITEIPGEYTATISGDDWYLAMFAVGNPFDGADTGATNGWDSASFSQEDWDDGRELTGLYYALYGDDSDEIETTDLGVNMGDMFAEIFGNSANYANTYWATDSGDFVGDNDTQDGFTFGSLPASDWLALVINGNTDEVRTITGSIGVPEPAALALFGFGLAGLAYARRRRQRKA